MTFTNIKLAKFSECAIICTEMFYCAGLAIRSFLLIKIMIVIKANYA